MKKLCLLICLLFAVQIVSAQNKVHEIGIEGGPNMYLRHSSNSVGFLTGVTYQLTKNNRSTFYTGVFYEEKNYRYKTLNPLSPDPIVQPADLRIKHLFISIPVMYRYWFCPTRKVQPFISAGGIFDIEFYSHYNSFYPTLSATIGTGMRANITGRLAISAELRAASTMLNYSSQLRFTPDYGGFYTTVQFLAGLSYRVGK